MASEGPTTPLARLRAARERVDAELARVSAEYDEAKRATDAHPGEMAAEAEKVQAQADALRPGLEAVVFGGARPGKGFWKKAERYQALTGRAGRCREARALAAPEKRAEKRTR